MNFRLRGRRGDGADTSGLQTASTRRESPAFALLVAGAKHVKEIRLGVAGDVAPESLPNRA